MKNSIKKLGYYSALAAFVASVGYDIAQILQVVGLAKYPFDAIFIYGFSLFIPIPFILAILSLHYTVADDKKIWTHAAIIFTSIYAAYVTLNYVVQLATVIPMTIKGTLDQFRVLDQTPHSLFWNIDALGYIFMGLATLFASPIFANKGVELWTKRFFLANALITPVIALVYFYPTFSYALLLLASPWMVTASGSMLFLALFFKKK
ncbi:hypothetical protein GYA27_04785 [candidate division WWE3 bacterium]|uniref:DUF4386 domain-containing protein n=1 Tax=candidate division WWE3 bacterium TaxID=2053526 RepID=A0A7X9DL45_UNCKA|nr:hypothetical protein [candidate division WWE3 bacterium]